MTDRRKNPTPVFQHDALGAAITIALIVIFGWAAI